MNKFFNKVEFWIFIFFLIRLIGITAPPLEIGHNWRQVTGLMVARNYLEVDANILLPRIDDHQGKSGIIGMEFPTLNYIYFGVSKLFSYTHWYGRLINLIVSSIGLVFFSKIIRRFFSHKVVLVSTIFLLGSIWFSFSRKMMPDTYCISLMFVGLYYGIKYLDKGKIINIVMYILFTSIAILSKIPAGIYFALLIPMMFGDFSRIRKAIISSLTLIPISLTYMWYFLWNPYLSTTYGHWYNAGKSIPEGFNEIISNLDLVFKNFYFHSFSGYIIFVFFLLGLFQFILHRNRFFILSISFPAIVFVIYILKSGFFFYHHSYYIIPFVPIMALIAGYCISCIRKRWVFVFCIIIGVSESVLNQQHDFFIKKSEKYKLELESIADLVSTKNELIAINGNDNPQQIYLTHRKGWTCTDSQIADESFINSIQKKGCRYIFINKHSCFKSINKKIVFNNENYIVYDLNTR
jgi:hypothetical protein